MLQASVIRAETVVQSLGGVYTGTLLAKWAVIASHLLWENEFTSLYSSLHARTRMRSYLQAPPEVVRTTSAPSPVVKVRVNDALLRLNIPHHLTGKGGSNDFGRDLEQIPAY